MQTSQNEPITITKEMGLTHQEFYEKLPRLLKEIPYQQANHTIQFQLHGKEVEISLGPEGVRELSKTARLPVTFVTLRFFGCLEAEIKAFVDHFNLRFLKGGG